LMLILVDLNNQYLPGTQIALVLKDPRPIDRNTAKMSNFNAVKGNWGTTIKTSDHPLKNMEDRGIFDSRCLGHMTGNKDHLDDFEECKGGSVTFGGSKGYITGKGRIRLYLDCMEDWSMTEVVKKLLMVLSILILVVY
ncbi:hypothetical protein Tco_0048634, partial [Tanacetum coccineum]